MNFSIIKIIIGVLVLATIPITHVMAGEGKQTAYRMTSPCYTCLRLVRDPLGRTNRLGNPIYQLEAYLKGQKIYSLETPKS